jgi:hypothetical protein
MSRKQRTEAEKAQTELSERISANKYLIDEIAETIGNIQNELGIDQREATCALRDYAQWSVARYVDLMAAGLDAQAQKLRDELAVKSRQ